MKQQDIHTKLPIIKVFMVVLTLPKRHFKELLRFGLPAIALGATTIIYSLAGSYYNDVISAGLYLILIFVLVNAIIACHRIFLLDRQAVESTPVIRFTLREVLYIGRWLVIGIVASFVIRPLSSSLFFFFLFIFKIDIAYFSSFSLIYLGLTYIPAYYLIARFSLALPATAIDDEEGLLSRSWGLSKGNGWRLTILFGTIPFLTTLLFWVLPSFESIFYSLLLGAAWLVVGVVEIGLLSLSYNYLSRMKVTNE